MLNCYHTTWRCLLEKNSAKLARMANRRFWLFSEIFLINNNMLITDLSCENMPIIYIIKNISNNKIDLNVITKGLIVPLQI